MPSLKALLILCALLGSFVRFDLARSEGHEPGILKGSIEKSAEIVRDTLQGQVLDASTDEPISGAQITVPELGYRMQTNSQGHYTVPRSALSNKPLIMSIEKPGYAPLSATIRHDALPRFYIRLNKQAPFLVLDNQLRHLGDGGYSAYSSNAGAFKTRAIGPAIQIGFTLDTSSLSNKPTLKIGSIIGIDTAIMHLLTGNKMIDASATPVLVKLNGKIISQISVNRDNQTITLPKALLNPHGKNTLAIESGYHIKDDGQLDYDDIEFMHLVVYP